MIGRLRGTVADRRTESVILDVGGVGYRIAVTPRTLVALPGLGEEAVLHTHLHVREDQLALFGFGSIEERDLFDLLLGASGVGPKVALAILATLTPDDLRRAVAGNDLALLTAVPGIGKRSAEKLMLELRPKMDVLAEANSSSGAMSQAREALENLGYSSEEIRDSLSDLSHESPVEELVTMALRSLGKRRMS
ncbi:MAG: Holliday junction branch migration protein RuvA [Actinomycetota bacterium]|nr:Holliday junction branch migration protein RuvA [Actinomycetota bacterium]